MKESTEFHAPTTGVYPYLFFIILLFIQERTIYMAIEKLLLTTSAMHMLAYFRFHSAMNCK